MKITSQCPVPEQIYAVLLPILIFVFFYIRRKNVYDLHHSILGNLLGVVRFISGNPDFYGEMKFCTCKP